MGGECRLHFADFVAFLVVIAAIIIGYYMPEIQFQQLSWHAPLGTAIFILTFFQVVSGYIRYVDSDSNGD